MDATADTSVLASTAFLTVLLAIGLFFFIRASSKDRTEEACFTIPDSESDDLGDRLKTHLIERAYRPIDRNAQEKSIVFAGQVRPSVGLAIFLSLLAALGFACLGLIWTLLLPQWHAWPLTIALLGPLAGWFYWRTSGRVERISLQIEPGDRAIIKAHRDELIALEQTLKIERDF